MDFSWSMLLDWIRPAIEYFLLALVIYLVLYYLRGTRAVNVLGGVIMVLLLLTLISEGLDLVIICTLLDGIWALLGMALVVIFQPELRRAFAQLGSYVNHLFFRRSRARETIGELVTAALEMSRRKIGAIIVIERRIGMQAIVEDAVRLDARLNSLLLQSLFYPNSPLHDGAVIVRNDRIVAARAILPLSRNTMLSRTMGTRHRAALGITEETDAVVLIVSEETGEISIACRGSMMGALSESALTDELSQLLLDHRRGEALTDIFSSMDEHEGAMDFHGDLPPEQEKNHDPSEMTDPSNGVECVRNKGAEHEGC